MVEYREGIPRQQLVLYQQCIDELVDASSIVGVIDAYIDSLDMDSLGFRVNEQTTGTAAYEPQLKLKIYVYGYLNGVRSSRRLERECRRNVELLWLTQGLAPDFKTIADFRKDNADALKARFKAFLLMCARLQLLGFDSVAIDGTKMRAQNSMNETYGRQTIEQVAEQVRQKIDAYLKELDELDEAERTHGVKENPEKIKGLTARLAKQQQRLDKIEQIRSLFAEKAELNTVFATDEDARLQSDKGKKRPGFNVQTAVDEKNKLIVVAEVTNEQNDKKQLTPMIERIRKQKNELEVDSQTSVIADTGYFSEAQIMGTKDAHDCSPVVSAGAEGQESSQSKSGKNREGPSEGYENDKFRYEEQRDVYVCPEKQELTRITGTPAIDRHGDRATHKYRAEAQLCMGCRARSSCTTSQKGRMIRVSANRKAMEQYLQLLKSPRYKRLTAQRKEIVEHPFGTLKRSLGYTYFLVKGLERAKAEFSLMCLAYNLKRVFNIVGFQSFMATIR